MTRRACPARDQARGFDCNFALTRAEAQAFRAHGYEFAVRYVRRADAHPYDLTGVEVDTILDAGLALMGVQHVESELRWTPSADKGAVYGAAAASHATSVGLPAGTLLWCDLEGVAPDTPERVVVDYCAAWHHAVGAGGYLPGLYVGWHAGLAPYVLFHALPFSHYWASYNLNADEAPIVRGVQMRQWVRVPADVPPGIGGQFDVDTILCDKLGGLPVWAVEEVDE